MRGKPFPAEKERLRLWGQVCWHVQIELFVQGDGFLLEIPDVPVYEDVVFDDIVHRQARHGDVLLARVGVHRRLSRHRSAQVLHGFGAGCDDRPIWLENSNAAYFHLLVQRVVLEYKLASGVQTRRCLHAKSCADFAGAGTIVLVTHRGVYVLVDKRFLREILLGTGVRLVAAGGCSRELSESGMRNDKQEKQNRHHAPRGVWNLKHGTGE